MTDLSGELSPAFEIAEPADWRAPIIFNSPHSGSVYPDDFLQRVADRPAGAAPLRRFVHGRVDRGSGRSRLPGRPGAFPALLCRRQSRALRTRSAHVRWAGCQALPIPDRCGWRAVSAPSRGWSAMARKSIASGYRIDDALARIETLYKPYHRALRRLINRAHQSFGTAVVVDCHSMPSVGVSRDEPRRPDIVIGDRYGTSCAALLADMVEETMSFAVAIRSAATSPMPAASSPSITATRRADCTRSSSNSTARSTWTSGARERGPNFAPVAADFAPAGRSARHRVPLADLGPFQAAAE